MVTDLAETMPETADKLTYVVKIRPNVRFHDTERDPPELPQSAGRQLTAEDVKYSIERQINRESPQLRLYYRQPVGDAGQDRDARRPQGLTLKITTKRPTAPFVHYLADTNAFIIAKELVELVDPNMQRAHLDKMVGSRPVHPGQVRRPPGGRACVRNPDWFAKDDLADQGLAQPAHSWTAIEAIVAARRTTRPPRPPSRSKQVDITGYVDSDNARAHRPRSGGGERTRDD